MLRVRDRLTQKYPAASEAAPVEGWREGTFGLSDRQVRLLKEFVGQKVVMECSDYGEKKVATGYLIDVTWYAITIKEKRRENGYPFLAFGFAIRHISVLNGKSAAIYDNGYNIPQGFGNEYPKRDVDGTEALVERLRRMSFGKNSTHPARVGLEDCRLVTDMAALVR